MNEPICYLCGQPIEGKKSMDHVPPSQFFTKIFRKTRLPNLLTLPTHEKCNKSYQSDEDYFFVALAGLNENVQIHEWIIDDVRKKIWREESQGLRQAVLSEFRSTFSGIYLPDNLVAKKFDLKRANRVVWKIIRGLCYHHYSQVLPANVKHAIRYWQVRDEPPKLYRDHLMETPVLGEYPEVFIYRFARVSNKDSLSTLWALIFWQSIVAIVPVVTSQVQANDES
jgi:hypothetical protein